MFGTPPGSSYIHKDGMSIPDPLNASVILNFVGTWSEHEPSWEVRTLPMIPTVLPYHPSTVALEPYNSPILVAYVPMLICGKRAGNIILRQDVCCFQLATGLPLPLKMGN